MRKGLTPRKWAPGAAGRRVFRGCQIGAECIRTPPDQRGQGGPFPKIILDGEPTDPGLSCAVASLPSPLFPSATVNYATRPRRSKRQHRRRTARHPAPRLTGVTSSSSHLLQFQPSLHDVPPRDGFRQTGAAGSPGLQGISRTRALLDAGFAHSRAQLLRHQEPIDPCLFSAHFEETSMQAPVRKPWFPPLLLVLLSAAFCWLSWVFLTMCNGFISSFSGMAPREEEKTGVHVDRAFTMCISDDDTEDAGSDSEVSSDPSWMTGTRFSCPEADFTDSEGSDYELDLEGPRNLLMDKTNLAESFLFELEREHQLKIKEEIRKRASALEAEVRNENERSLSAIARLEKHMEARREMDRRLDKQYQRKIAEALDCHLSIVQRDHEQRSQIEERRIKDAAALEEAKKKEKALQEEKVRRVKAEAEARQEAARIVEEKRKAALEAASISMREHLGKDEGKTSKTIPGETTGKQLEPKMPVKEERPIQTREVAVPSTRTGLVVTAADSALKAAADRLARHVKGSELYDKLVSSSDKDFDNYQRQIARRIRQLTGTVENVRTKSSELSNIMKDPRCPYPVSLMIFSKKILNLCENPGASFDGIAFAVGHVIVRVTAQVPATMDFVLAEFHKACIFTVPKFVQPSKVTNRAKEYHKLIGYREENGMIENTDSYLERVESYMKLYAALVQTEIGGIPNPHGIKEGWAWLARFLNVLPANRFTAVALEAFLKMSGFALFQKYKAQFRKMLNVISNKFLPALKAQGGSDVSMIISKLETYLEKKQYLKEPDGRRLQTTLSSRLHMA